MKAFHKMLLNEFNYEQHMDIQSIIFEEVEQKVTVLNKRIKICTSCPNTKLENSMNSQLDKLKQIKKIEPSLLKESKSAEINWL